MVRLLQQAAKIDRQSMKISMFWGTSISEAFWEDFGRVLGCQNPRFSHFFRCFFDVNFEERFRRAKNQPKRPNKSRKRKFSGGFRRPQPPGERKREGNKSLGLHKELGLSDSPSVMGQDVSESDLVYGPARPAHLRWAAD